jgi:hypothetical protein
MLKNRAGIELSFSGHSMPVSKNRHRTSTLVEGSDSPANIGVSSR